MIRKRLRPAGVRRVQNSARAGMVVRGLYLRKVLGGKGLVCGLVLDIPSEAREPYLSRNLPVSIGLSRCARDVGKTTGAIMPGKVLKIGTFSDWVGLFEEWRKDDILKQTDHRE